MNGEEISIVMEPFKQLHTLSLNSNEGTGLGLTLTKKLVKAHGGKLEMESEPAVGTTVKDKFPKEKVMTL